MDRRELYFEVEGEPIPQGSMRVFKDRIGNSYLTHASKSIKAWRNKVSLEAYRAYSRDHIEGGPFLGPLFVYVNFVLSKPKSATRNRPFIRPDIDKLVRAVLDALTNSEVIKDDAQVVEIQAVKRYARYGQGPQAAIYIKEMEDV